MLAMHVLTHVLKQTKLCFSKTWDQVGVPSIVQPSAVIPKYLPWVSSAAWAGWLEDRGYWNSRQVIAIAFMYRLLKYSNQRTMF